MIGSYPLPSWFREQLGGRDIGAFMVIHHAEAFRDAVRTVVKDQELAGRSSASRICWVPRQRGKRRA